MIARICTALLALVFLAPSALAQESPAAVAVEVAAIDAATAAAEAADDEAEHVIVPGKPTRKMIYQFFQELGANDFCPPGLETPRGFSCAEVTYEIFDARGKSLGKCNIPIFRLYRSAFQYTALTFDKVDCSKKPPHGRSVAPVGLEELFNPRTKDGTVFKKIGVMGIDQARDLCEISEDICVLKLFDREGQLTFCTMRRLWGLPGNRKDPKLERCAGRK